MAAQQFVPNDFEIVVVDNGSTDGTRDVVKRWMSVLGNFRLEAEPALGLSRARNAGIRVAKGDVVAFVDDDAVAARGWLAALLDGYSRWPEVAAVVGPVRLAWLGKRPAWLLPAMERWFSGLDLGDHPRLLQDSETPFGTNMSMRRGVVNGLGGFAVELGRKGTGLISNDERELFSRVRHAGHAIAYEPSAAIWHRVGKDRLTPGWLIRRAYAQGRSDVALARLRPDEVGRAVPTPRRALGMLLAATIRGWPEAVNTLIGADNKAGLAMTRAIRRARCLGYARETLIPSLTPREGGERHFNPWERRLGR
jgi:glycosyltransferase involved in cell wall biosynthesis